MEVTVNDFVGIEEWLTIQGADVLKPTNEWEVVRFRSTGNTYVAYRNKHGRVSANNSFVWKVLESFRKKRPMALSGVKTKRTKYSVHRDALIRRDGDRCFYCGIAMTPAEMTVEHILPLDKGGPNSLANMCLCHAECNAMAANKPIVAKINLRDSMRGGW